MSNKLSTLALFISGIVLGFLLYEWFSPTSSLALLVAMVILSIIGLCLSLYALKKETSKLIKIALFIGAAISALMIIVFSIMFVMGLGA